MRSCSLKVRCSPLVAVGLAVVSLSACGNSASGQGSVATASSRGSRAGHAHGLRRPGKPTTATRTAAGNPLKKPKTSPPSSSSAAPVAAACELLPISVVHSLFPTAKIPRSPTPRSDCEYTDQMGYNYQDVAFSYASHPAAYVLSPGSSHRTTETASQAYPGLLASARAKAGTTVRKLTGIGDEAFVSSTPDYSNGDGDGSAVLYFVSGNSLYSLILGGVPGGPPASSSWAVRFARVVAARLR